MSDLMNDIASAARVLAQATDNYDRQLCRLRLSLEAANKARQELNKAAEELQRATGSSVPAVVYEALPLHEDHTMWDGFGEDHDDE